MINAVRDLAWIEVALPVPTPVTVEVVDVLGRRVWGSEDRQAPAGVHRRPLPLTGLAPGLYFVRLRTREGSAVQKLIVAR